jgi:hypothetical protein
MSDTFRNLITGILPMFKEKEAQKITDDGSERLRDIMDRIAQHEADLDKQLLINKALGEQAGVQAYDTSKCEADQVVYVDIGSGVRRSAYLGWK